MLRFAPPPCEGAAPQIETKPRQRRLKRKIRRLAWAGSCASAFANEEVQHMTNRSEAVRPTPPLQMCSCLLVCCSKMANRQGHPSEAKSRVP
mmetsp:Transcript_49935/g.99113  ORF Transcript_49935/g.99113 Transcript_49935/m.99113 type:complete len:92 (-) Transcript_49935:170-445(-)